jgi:hypothetical protein
MESWSNNVLSVYYPSSVSDEASWSRFSLAQKDAIVRCSMTFD